MLESIAQMLLALHFQYTEQFLAALLPMSLTVVLLGECLHHVGRDIGNLVAGTDVFQTDRIDTYE